MGYNSSVSPSLKPFNSPLLLLRELSLSHPQSPAWSSHLPSSFSWASFHLYHCPGHTSLPIVPRGHTYHPPPPQDSCICCSFFLECYSLLPNNACLSSDFSPCVSKPNLIPIIQGTPSWHYGPPHHNRLMVHRTFVFVVIWLIMSVSTMRSGSLSDSLTPVSSSA